MTAKKVVKHETKNENYFVIFKFADDDYTCSDPRDTYERALEAAQEEVDDMSQDDATKCEYFVVQTVGRGKVSKTIKWESV